MRDLYSHRRVSIQTTAQTQTLLSA